MSAGLQLNQLLYEPETLAGLIVQYDKILAMGYRGLINEIQEELDSCNIGDEDYCAS